MKKIMSRSGDEGRRPPTSASSRSTRRRSPASTDYIKSEQAKWGALVEEARPEGLAVAMMPDGFRTRLRWSPARAASGPGWGNGRATAVLFAREGAKVFAVDKNGESMKETLDRVAEFGGTDQDA